MRLCAQYVQEGMEIHNMTKRETKDTKKDTGGISRDEKYNISNGKYNGWD